MRYFTSLLFVFSACSAAENKNDTASEDSGVWWNQDTATDGETDEPEEDYEDEEVEAGTYYYGVVDVSTWAEGYFVYETFDEEGTGCVIEGAMIDISTPDTCSDCVIDMTATIIGLEVTENLGGCDDSESVLQSFEGLEVAYGQGNELVFEEEGYDFYDLFEAEQDSWNLVNNGFSVTGVDEEFGMELWGFYLFID